MIRRAIPVAACLALVLLGCEKKEPEAQPPVRPVAPAAKAPPGMVAVRPGAEVFISEQPFSVAQYVAYLKGTTQPVPAEYEGRLADEPASGLPRSEAERCATWHLMRLPTFEEWQQASAVVGARPYPWADDGSAVAAGAEAFLVQDWPPGSPGEEAARAARQELADRILADARADVAELRDRLEGMIEPRRAVGRELWQQIKPVFFSLLDRQKGLAEATARREGRAEVIEILNRLVLAKGKLAAAVKAAELEDTTAEDALQAYTDQLAQVRAKLQQVRDGLQKATAASQEQVVALTRAFEEMGTAEAAGRLEEAEAALAESAVQVDAVTQAEALKASLQSAVARLAEAGPAFENLPSVEDMNQRIAALDLRIAQLADQQAAAGAIQEAADKMERLGKAVSRQFLEEKVLLKELNELVELRARKKAVEANLNGLREALEASAPEQAQ